MQLVEVTNAQLAKDFLLVNVLVNKGNPNYIRPLDKDIQEVFDPQKNKVFRFGKAVRWLLKTDSGELIGRIAAFVNKKYKTVGDDVPVGGIGFFDCIQDQEAAHLLFDTAKQWLTRQGMEAMDGPINFGERDRWWGLLVEGFQEPLYGMNYNPPYYKELFETYGFKIFFHQICLALDPQKNVSDKIIERHALYADKPEFKVVQIQKNKLEKFAEDFTTVYNAAWAQHGSMKQLSKGQVVQMFRKMKPVMDEKIIWFTYRNEKPIAMYINLPDLNQWFKHLNGQFGWFHKLKFLWIKMTKPCYRFTGLVFGVIPEFQGKGIDSFMIAEASKVLQQYTSYAEYEMQWIGDFHPKMLNVALNISDTFQSRKLTTYRYLFDRTKEFKRHPILGL